MDTWFAYLKRGLSRQLPADRLSWDRGPAGTRADLANLRPFLARHGRKGLLGALLVLVNALLAFPLPLLMRTLVDDVILAQQLGWLLPVVGAMVVVVGAGMLATAWQQFCFARFGQEVLFDIQREAAP